VVADHADVGLVVGAAIRDFPAVRRSCGHYPVPLLSAARAVCVQIWLWWAGPAGMSERIVHGGAREFRR
jgi:hypothetical protein